MTTNRQPVSLSPWERQLKIAAANLKLIFRGWWIVFTLAAGLQMILWPETTNIECVLLAWSSCVATGLVILRSRVTVAHPWSSLMVLMFCLQTCGLPLIFLLLQGDPLTHNLEVPVATFSHLLICQILLLLIHISYHRVKFWRQVQNRLRLKVLRPLGLLETPSRTEILAMGVVGLIATAYIGIFLPDQSGGNLAVTGSVWVKFVQGINVLMFLPFLLLIPQATRRPGEAIGSQVGSVALYSLPVLFIALAVNSRGAIFLGFALAGISLVLLLISGKMRLVLKRNIIFGLIGLLIISTIGSDIAIAMRVARQNRGSLSTSEIALESLKLLTTDRRELTNLRGEMRQGDDLDEAWYVTSPVFSRLVSTHFQDRALAAGLSMGEGAKEWLRQVEIEHTLATLPNPLLQKLGIGINKNDPNIGGSSMGAWMIYLGGISEASGMKSVFMNSVGTIDGGIYATGGFIGDGYAAYGWGYLLLFGGVAFLFFLFSDSLYGCVNQPTREHPFPPTHFAMVGLVNGYALAGVLNGESLSGLISFALRQPLQWLVVYAVVFWAVRLVTRTLFGNGAKALGPRKMAIGHAR